MAVLNEETIENFCKTLFDYSAVDWLRDGLVLSSDSLSGKLKKFRAYSFYPRLAVKAAINWVDKTAENYSVNIQTKSLGVNYYDEEFSKPLMEVVYPGITFGLSKEEDRFVANFLGFRMSFSESVMTAKSILDV